MLKFITKGKAPQPTAEQQRLQKDLFAYRKTIQHGFPNKPTGLAWDPGLSLVAIGTTTGAIKVLGKPGVEFYGHHPSSDHAVTKLVFIPNEGRLVSLCDDNSLHLWEINKTLLVEVKAQVLEGKLKKVSAIIVQSTKEHVLLGTEGGNIYLLKLPSFEVSDTVIFQDVVVQNVAETYKINPGAVEAIAEQPGDPDTILIGYNRGLMVLWNLKEAAPVKSFICNQDLESICWHESGKQFISSHNDGSYAQWDVDSTEGPIEQPTTVYGPFPCKAIPKILWKSAFQEPHDDMLIFSGGMPRASYSDRYTITVQRGTKKHVTFDFTSKIVDFFTIDATDDEKGVTTLIALAEEEIVGIDLTKEDWPMLNLPYLVSLHASAVIFSTYLSDVPQSLWNDIISVGKVQTEGLYSDSEWPIKGGVIEEEKGGVSHRDLLLTGHEDGSVRFWDAGGVALVPLYTYKSSQLLRSEEDVVSMNGDAAEEEEEEWPPFRKVGCFDPYSDDPRLAVKKVSLCAVSGTLAVAGTSGHIIIAKLSLTAAENSKIKVRTVNLVSDRDSFVWKGHEKLPLKGKLEDGATTISVAPGFQPCSVLQLHPPAAITALALHADWNLVAAGTAHGLAMYNFATHSPVLSKCTLNPNSIALAGDAPISRRKSFKKSLRESFRRLRKGRHSMRQSPEKRKIPPPVNQVPVDRRSAESGGIQVVQVDSKPVERAIEARPADDGFGSMVRCLYFANSFIISMQHSTPMLWAGTNNGTVYIFTITLPPRARRNEDKVLCQLGKEIQLRHRAPVVGISIVDGANKPLPEPFEVEKGLCKPVDVSAPHRVIIGSEEQFKIFALPSLKPLCKLKLTAVEGARVRKMSLASFSTPHHAETCLLCLTNLGECIVFSVPELRRQINAAVIRREDINGISSLAFTRHGEGLYLHSSSELQRVTLSASRITVPHCSLKLGVSSEENSPVKNTSLSPALPPATPPPVITNGISEDDGDADEEDEDKKEIKENGITDTTSSSHDLSSVGDITIDSVRDHLTNTSL
nr:PREDICTED: protein lethal(2) giant larvae-like [Bemisia tabaci]